MFYNTKRRHAKKFDFSKKSIKQPIQRNSMQLDYFFLKERRNLLVHMVAIISSYGQINDHR